MMRLVPALLLALALALPAPALGAGDPLRPQQWNLDMIESDAAHATARGTGAVVAVVDSGVNAGHPDLGGRLLPGHDFVDDDGTPQDGDGHGTHVTGIVAANDGNGVGVSSVAPGARVLPVRVLNDSGAGDSGDVAAGIDYAVAHGAQVINLSLGEDVPLIGGSPEFSAAIDRALDKGVIVVAASGNNGLPACEQPSAQGRLLCVGAVDRRGMRSFFSSFGQGLGLVAPGGSGASAALNTGEDVLSTWRTGGYEELAGTSQAAPHVAGVAALLVSKGVRGQAAANRILATAKDAGPPGPDPEYGAGIVNARAAVAGLSGSAGGSGARVWIPRVQRLRSVLRRGIKVRCRAAGAGRCRARATRRKRTLAYGSRRVKPGTTVTLYAKPNRRGRAVIRRALRRHRSLRVRVRITLPGTGPVRRLIRLKP
ncbi:MAG TPA: S8 family peptidase [Vicinamibacteria bacterium]